MPSCTYRSQRRWASRRAAQHVADTLRSQQHPADLAFDRWLPEDLREVSMQYWTPLRVVRRAGEWLADVSARHIVDVGSGAGKFCIASALISSARFTGVEQSASLIASARTLAKTFGVSGRVTFVQGTFGATGMPIADVYYFYNPFGSYWFHSTRDDEAELDCSTTRRADEVALAGTFIRSVPAGTYLLTYNGFGGRMPDCLTLPPLPDGVELERGRF